MISNGNEVAGDPQEVERLLKLASMEYSRGLLRAFVGRKDAERIGAQLFLKLQDGIVGCYKKLLSGHNVDYQVSQFSHTQIGSIIHYPSAYDIHLEIKMV